MIRALFDLVFPLADINIDIKLPEETSESIIPVTPMKRMRRGPTKNEVSKKPKNSSFEIQKPDTTQGFAGGSDTIHLPVSSSPQRLPSLAKIPSTSSVISFKSFTSKGKTHENPAKKIRTNISELTTSQDSLSKSNISTQTDPKLIQQRLKRVIIPESELPSSKLKAKRFQISASDSRDQKFSKIYEMHYPHLVFKSIRSLLSEESDHRSPAKPTEVEETITIESNSNVSDSFITPEESPLLSASPAPVVSAFQLESPLIHSVKTTAIEGWGEKSSGVQAYSPMFPMATKPETLVKSVVLFPVFGKPEELAKDDKKQFHEETRLNDEPDDMEIFLVKEHSQGENNPILKEPSFRESNFGLKEQGERSMIKEQGESNATLKGQSQSYMVFREMSQGGGNFMLDNQIENNFSLKERSQAENKLTMNELNQGGNDRDQSLSVSKATGFLLDKEKTEELSQDHKVASGFTQPSENPFLNVSAANITKPQYVFGSGKVSAINSFVTGENPFLLR